MISQVSATSAYQKNSPSFGMGLKFTKSAARTLREQFDNPESMDIITRQLQTIRRVSDEKGFDVLLTPSKKDNRELRAIFKLKNPSVKYLVNPSPQRIPVDNFANLFENDTVANSMSEHVAGSISKQTQKFQSLANFNEVAQIQPGRIKRFFARLFGR